MKCSCWLCPFYLGKNSGEWLWTTPALLTLKCRQWGPVNMAFTVVHRPLPWKVLSGTVGGAVSEACFLCVSTYCGGLPWMGGLWEVLSHQYTMHPLGNVNTHSTQGQAHSDWPELPCKEWYFVVPFIYNGWWKINMLVKSIFKNKREATYLRVFAERKSISCGIFWSC